MTQREKNVYRTSLEHVPRRAVFAPPVREIGRVTGQTERERTFRTQDTMEVCLRTAGEGESEALDFIEGREYRTPFPHVYLKFPGREYRYALPKPRWAIFFTYRAETAEELVKKGILPEQPFLRIELTPEILTAERRLVNLMDRTLEPGVAETVDLLCLELLSEFTAPAKPETPDAKILSIASRMKADYDADFESMAESLGMTPRTFYRHWNRLFPLTPARYAAEQKLREGARLLKECSMTVSEVAARLNFPDESYFAKVFRKRFGVSPGVFRGF